MSFWEHLFDLFILVSARFTTMSADSSTIASLLLIGKNFYRIGGPILMVLGSVSCILSLMVFMKKNLRQNPCSIYLIAVNISSLLLIFTSILFNTLETGYNINLNANNLSFCSFRFYVMFIFDILSPSYLILASVDRCLVTSPNAAIRRRSTRRLAFVCIFAITLFWLLFHIHLFFFTKLFQFESGSSFCYFQPGIYTTFIGIYSLVIKNILIPMLMLIFGLWTLKHIRIVTHVADISFLSATNTVTIRHIPNRRSKDRQLIRILLIDIIVFILFNLLVCIVLMYQQFNPNHSSNPLAAQIQNLLFQVGVFSTYIPFCIGCYTNALASKTFRTEIRNIFLV